ncbi:unnamed protein product [Boreogadus saida]
MMERANLAVTLAVRGVRWCVHASFLDAPYRGLVDLGAIWERLQAWSTSGCRSTRSSSTSSWPAGFAPDSVREILRAALICLLSPHLHPLDPVLEEVFEPLQTHPDAPPCVGLISHRHHYCPRLHVRQGREEDHDGLCTSSRSSPRSWGRSWAATPWPTLLEKQDPQHQTAVCEDAHHLGSRQLEPPARWERVPRSAEQTVPHVDLPQNITRGVYGYRESGGAAVGFMSVSTDVELEVLDQSFDLGAFGGLYRPSPDTHPAPPPDSPTEPAADQGGAVEDGGGEVGQQGAPEASSRQPNVFCVQMFVMDKEHETRSLDFLPYVFKLFPDRDLCVIAVPRRAPEGPLLQGFQRVPPRPGCTPHQELYLFHRTGLLRSFMVRRAVSADRAAVCDLVAGVTGHRTLLDDLDMFLQARRDPEGVPLEALVAQVEGQVVGVVILRDEEDVEFLRAPLTPSNPLCPPLAPQDVEFLRAPLTPSAPSAPQDDVEFPAGPSNPLCPPLAPQDVEFLRAPLTPSAPQDVEFLRAPLTPLPPSGPQDDVEFLRAHYGVESFVYFSQHGAREHGRLRHLRLLPLFQHLTRHLLRDVHAAGATRQLPVPPHYPPLHPAQLVVGGPPSPWGSLGVHGPPGGDAKKTLHAEGCVHDCMVPLAPRRQVVYPLGELGHNAPSWRIMQQQEPFALRFLSRKHWTLGKKENNIADAKRGMAPPHAGVRPAGRTGVTGHSSLGNTTRPGQARQSCAPPSGGPD